ncbi:FixH family protein [Pendulispora brunnea]|uniref:FixH family protein n=1 Tax=Pendulispora brunnea TaxID=2905690 RepID=A0ABZ2JWL2_9BACT
MTFMADSARPSYTDSRMNFTHVVPSAALLLSGFLAALPACSSDSSSPPPNDGGGVVTCQNDPRVMAYQPNLTLESGSKSFKATLVSADPAPPVVSSGNTWMLKLVDGSGAPITGADIEVVPYMPDHGHNPPTKVLIAKKDNGTYELSKINFFMPGVWWVTINVTLSGAADSVRFAFCLPG